MQAKKIIGCKEIDDYIQKVESGKINASKDVKQLCEIIRDDFESGNSYVDTTKLENYRKIGEKMFPVVLDWELFLIALLLCTYTKGHKVRWRSALIMIGRGAGKDGFIAWMSLCLISRYNPVRKYDVDICANNEDQSLRPIQEDAREFLENPEFVKRNKTSFRWTRESIEGLTNGGKIKGRTNNPKGKDGLRSGCVILNEIHQYENYANINVFTTGLGKKAEPRMIYLTTNGNVREGVLDDLLNTSTRILNKECEDGGLLPFLCRLDSRDEVHDSKNWEKANPSLPYFDSLFEETEREYKQWVENPSILPAFMEKRMNLPLGSTDTEVVPYEYIKATNKPIIDLKSKQCIVGVDLSRTSDMTSVSALFKVGDTRYVINHSWICRKSKDWEKIKVKEQFPKWQQMGLLTVVDDEEIAPRLIAEYIQSLKREYQVIKVVIDDFRFSIFSRELSQIGFSKDKGNLKMTRRSDIAKVIPVIERMFLNGYFAWGDNPVLRWATNNTKVYSWRPNTTNADVGNMQYGKIEAKSRKNDAFMSLVQAMCCENELLDIKAIMSNKNFKIKTF